MGHLYSVSDSDFSGNSDIDRFLQYLSGGILNGGMICRNRHIMIAEALMFRRLVYGNK